MRLVSLILVASSFLPADRASAQTRTPYPYEIGQPLTPGQRSAVEEAIEKLRCIALMSLLGGIGTEFGDAATTLQIALENEKIRSDPTLPPGVMETSPDKRTLTNPALDMWDDTGNNGVRIPASTPPANPSEGYIQGWASGLGHETRHFDDQYTKDDEGNFQSPFDACNWASSEAEAAAFQARLIHALKDKGMLSAAGQSYLDQLLEVVKNYQEFFEAMAAVLFALGWC